MECDIKSNAFINMTVCCNQTLQFFSAGKGFVCKAYILETTLVGIKIIFLLLILLC